MGKIIIAGAGVIYDPQSADYPPSSSGTAMQTFSGTIDPALGYKDIIIENGTAWQVQSVAWTEDLTGGVAVASAHITSATNLRVYSSLGIADPGSAFTVSLVPA